MKIVKENINLLSPKSQEESKRAIANLFFDIDLWLEVIKPLRAPIYKAIEKTNISSDELISIIKKSLEESGVFELLKDDIDSDIEEKNMPGDIINKMYDYFTLEKESYDYNLNDMIDMLKSYKMEYPNVSYEDIDPAKFFDWVQKTFS